MTGPWRLALRRWSRLNRSRKRRVDGAEAPSRRDEYLLYQTLIGTVPMHQMDDTALGAYRERMQPIARFGLLNSLSQTVIKLTSPGVPDIYRGTESWDFSLVDPDNRRPVDYPRLAAMLDEVAGWDSTRDGLGRQVRALIETLDDGRAKLYVTWRLLGLRARHAELFRDGAYLPLRVVGAQADHVCAFARSWVGRSIVVVAPRLFASLPAAGAAPPLGPEVWQDTAIELEALPPLDRVTCVLVGQTLTIGAGRRILLREALSHFPVAVFEGQ
jgi:(1->4)-alpha-D-glucan 1-alpha-D-glucosylmutase